MRRIIRLPLVFFGTLTLLSGCMTTSSFVTNTPAWYSLPLAVPLQASVQQELKLARIDQILLQNPLTELDRAGLYFERGLVNDSLGLREIAQFDFKRSLSLNPAQADIFNILGIYFTQTGMYDAAYEAFDSTLELNENHLYAERNRGIALYYGGRYKLAERDLLAHYENNIEDPYRVIWLYLLEKKYLGEEIATENLKTRYQGSNKKDWGWQITRLYLDEINEQAFFNDLMEASQNNVELAGRLTEAYFYLAKRYQAQGNIRSAVALYKLSLSMNVYEFVEHRYAILELSKIAEQADLAGEA